MSAEDLHSWFLARTGPVCAYEVEDQYQLFSTRHTAMVKLVDTSDKLQPAILVRNAVFNRFRNMLPAVQRAQIAPEETGYYTQRGCYPGGHVRLITSFPI
jgi:hypothetical protein